MLSAESIFVIFAIYKNKIHETQFERFYQKLQYSNTFFTRSLMQQKHWESRLIDIRHHGYSDSYIKIHYIMENRVTKLFNIKYPIIQGGMVWCSGWRLASAVSNNGGLGLLGAGSMHPEMLVEHIRKMKEATDKPWGINVPLLYPEIDRLMDIIIQEGVKIVFTSAGSPKKWTPLLKSHGITVVHVVSSALFAKKCEEAGVDAIVAEGFEAGGHNGREETTTLTLIPNVAASCSLPVIAAGGISSGKSVAATMTLGAEGVQIGTRFAFAAESSAHNGYSTRKRAAPYWH